MTRNKYLDYTRSNFIKRLLRFPAAGIFVHWIFQGLLYMDWTERLFKLSVDVLLTIVFALLLGLLVPQPWHWFIAFFLAHTSNFLLNSHLWTLLKHYGIVSQTKVQYTNYAEGLFKRISSQRFITYAAVYGSWVRGEWSPASDLDVRVIHIGLISGLRTCWFILAERTRALFNRFPLDIYVLDGFERLAEMRQDEKPQVIVDNQPLVH